MFRRHFLSVVGGIAFALALLFGAGAFSPDEAVAQTSPPKYFDPVTKREAEIFKKIIEASYGPDEAKRATARKILTRQATRTVPRLVPAAVGAGGAAAGSLAAPVALGALAAGSWTVVGLELYYLPCWDCGSESVSVGTEIRPAEGAILSTNVNGSTSVSKVQTMVTSYGGTRDASGNYTMWGRTYTRVLQWVTGTNTKGKWWSAPPSNNIPDGYSASVNVVPAELGNFIYQPSEPTYRGNVSKELKGVTGSKSLQLTVSTSTSNSSYEICPASPVECNRGDVNPPTIEAGSWGESLPTGNHFKTSPQEGNDFINAVNADPGTIEVLPEEDRPAPMEPDPDWDPDKDPFNPLFNPFEDPEGDPDRDGVPNRTDDDPEGDGDPDGDGDPNEHPRPVPFPQTDDPEHDGDPDGDGDPDETNPYQPQPDPYDPDTAPQEDPDDDGIPNEYDPDPVNPTDPQTLPPENPYADPDTDGEPNRQDEDDDGDGIPDTDDPQPYTPTDPGDLPNDNPYADPDHDGDPNHSDPDDDGDGLPDTEDPAPHDPSKPDDAPQADPDGDGQPNDQDEDDDGDGVPDVDDPAPYDPTKPGDGSEGSPGDRDGDGTPDATDPEPDNPQVPEGGPEGDPDGDGSPNKWDPEPTNPSNPEGGPQGDPDGDGVPNSEDPAPNDPNVPGEEGASCPIPREASFDLPKLEIGNVFPFSLVVWAWEAMGQLSAAPKAPVFDLGVIGVVDFSRSPAAQSFASLARTCIWLVGGVGMAFLFYSWIRSGSS